MMSSYPLHAYLLIFSDIDPHVCGKVGMSPLVDSQELTHF